MNEAKDCMHYHYDKRFSCGMNVLDSVKSGSSKKYNCKVNGACHWFKSWEEHRLHVARSREERDVKEYKRLKEKFEGVKVD